MNRNILIVEDSLTQAGILRSLLKERSWIVSHVLNGKEALTAIVENRPAVVISDIVMPEMDGYQLCQAIKSNSDTSDLPVLLVTSLSDVHEVIKGLECGADSLLVKPYNIDLLSRCLEDVVTRDGSTDHENDKNRSSGSTAGSIVSDPQQVMNFLLSTYENSMFQNRELQEIQEQLADANERLEEKVSERTIELEKVCNELKQEIDERLKAAEEKEKLEAQLRQSQKLETIGTLAGGIAHDFNNILTPIFGYITLIQNTLPSDSDLRSKLDHVYTAANRAKDLVSQILVFSREVEQEKQLLQFHLIVKEALKLLEASLPSTIEIRRDIDDDSGTILADPSQMHQVLMNLCTNAFHTMRETGGILEVSMKTVDVDSGFLDTHTNLQEGQHIRLSVSDTGHGMDQATMERIFEPFFTTKDTGEGTGLGLSVVHGIISGHGGEITVYSEPGEGTTFNIYIPRVGEEIAERIQEAISSPIELNGDERILFVDDEEAITFLGKEMLENLGYEVTAKTSSKETLDVFSQCPDEFDLLMTDQIMPEMTGTELISNVRSIRPDIPVILTSGFSEVITKEKGDEIGINGYVRKPYVLRDLGMTIRQVFEEAQVES